MAKKKKELSLEEKLEQALVPIEEQPYEVPKNWNQIYLKSVVSLEDGKKISGEEHKYLEVKYLRGNKEPDIKDSGKYVENGAYVILVDGENSGEIFKLSESGYMGSTFKKLSISNNLDTDYILYFIQQNKEFLRNNKKGSAIPHLNKELFGQLVLSLPPVEEQKRIVKVIESMFAKLDAAKEIAENIVDGYEQHKLSIFNKAFSGELTCDRDYGNSGQDTIKNIASYAENISKKDKCNIQSFQNQVQYIEMDDGRVWAKTQIGAIGIVTNGSTPSRKCPEYWNGDIPWVSSGEVRNNELFFTNEKITQDGYDNSSVKLLPKGTVLIAMIGEGKTRGQSAVLSIEATTNQNIAAIVIDHGMIEPKYLWFWLQMQYRKNREKGSGSGPQALNCQRVRELEILVPSIEEQRDIVKILDSIIKKEEKMLNVAEQTLESIDSMKKSILAKAFRGELGTNIEFEESSIELLKEILGGVN